MATPSSATQCGASVIREFLLVNTENSVLRRETNTRICLTCDRKDLRTEGLLDRKQELRRLLARACAPLKYTEYIDGCGTALFQRVCELDLEGIVAKQKFGPYVTEREHSTWFKILNRKYSQKDGREELFERERHSEPVAGWHVCALACAALEAATGHYDQCEFLSCPCTESIYPNPPSQLRCRNFNSRQNYKPVRRFNSKY